MSKSMRFIILSFISIFMFQHSAFSADLVFTDDLRPYSVNWDLPQGAEVSDIPPAGVVLPVFTGDEQRYGTIAFGDSIDPNFHFAIDLFGISENMHTYRFYFDRNKNNDLTDDGGPWEAPAFNTTKIPTFNIPYSTGMNRPYSFKLYVYFADWGDLKYHVGYYRDCGWTGTVSISSTNSLPILLMDDDTDGIYNTLWSDLMIIDLDEDNIPEGYYGSGELIRHFDAFLLNDAAYALDTVAIDGTDVTFKPVPIGTLSGTIQSNTGTLLYGTKVEASQSITQTTYTDSDGLYSLSLPLGQWRLRSSLYGYIPAYENVTITENQSAVWNVDMVPIPYPNSGTITLYEGDSYDFATGKRGQYSGGDFYYSTSSSKFWANNYYQRGVIDLGDMGSTTLTEINLPESGYTQFGIDAVVGHTYVSLAREGEEGCYIAFRVISMDSLSVTIDYNFIMNGDPVTLPTVYTNAVDSIMLTSAISGGNVTSDGGATVSQKGICWSTSPLPSILDSKSVSGSGTGVFSNLMTDLMPETTYHVRAYATNIAGTGYGAPVSFTTLAPTRVINLNGGLAFGDVQVGESRKLTFTISNSGNSTLNVSSITYPAGFAGNWTSGSVAASSTQTITVTFTPTTAATYGGTIIVDSDKTSGINTLSTTGTGIQQTRIMDLSSGSLDFGNVNVNTTKQLPFTITNNGNTLLTVSSINYPSGFTANWNAGTISPGASQPITVSFKPTATQVYNGIITINSDMTSGTNSMAVSGTGAVFYTISGYVRDTNDNGIDGVTLTFSNGKGTATTDLTGYYSKIIDSGWTGLVTPSKNGISFTPSNRSYSNINSDRIDQDYAGGPPTTTFRIWIDKNWNQIYDIGEAIPGATVWINNETVEHGVTDDQGIILIPNINNADQLYVQKTIYEMDNPKAVDSNFSNSQNNNPYYAGSVNGKMYHFVMASDIMANDGTYHDFPGSGKNLLDVPKDPQGNMLIQLVHPKIEWNLVVAFEEAQSTSFYEQIETGFENYADYMYNFTDGYFVVKNVVLVKDAYIDTPQWNYCDVQIKNAEWPNAFPFGNRYNYPVHIHMGKEWGGAQPDQYDWYSTLGHESGHYLLGFYDEYVNGNYTKGGANNVPWTYRFEHDGDPPDEPNEFSKNYGVMDYQYEVHEISDPTDYFPRTYSSSMDPDLVTGQFMYREGLSCWSFFKSYYEDEIKQQMVVNGLTDFSDEFFNNLIEPPHQTGSYPESDRTKRPNPNTMNHDSVNFIEWTLPTATRRAARSENIFDASVLVLDATGSAVVDADVWLVSPDRISFQGKSGRDGAVKCSNLSPGKYLEAYHHGEKVRLLIDAIQEKYILTLPPMKSTLSSSSLSSSSGMLIVAKPGISDSKHLMVTAAGSGLNIAPAVTLSQSHGYSVDIPMLNSGINKYTGSGDAQYDSGVLQVTLDTHQSVSPFVIYSTDLGPASGYYAPNGELEMVYSSNTFEGSGSFVILNSSALAPPNLGMVQIGNVYSFGFADTILSVRNVILNIKLPESGKGANLNLYGWDINNAMWIEIPGGNYNLDYFSISLASLMEYPTYGLFALPQANDSVPPGPVSGLRTTTGDKLWNIDLQWTLPNDTDLLALDIRFNTEPVSMANWQQCQAISNKLEPATPGTIQHTSVEMPDPGTMYYFGIMAIDVSGNVSPLTTLNTPVRSNATDADGDGIPDLWETSNGLNPLVSDAANDDDGDMITNLEEYQYRTAPYNSDTDKDGYSDGDEIAQGTNPNDFESFPDPLLYGGCEGDSWVPEVHFKYEDSNFKETMAWISGWSYSLTEVGKYNKANGIKGNFCLPECGYISSKFLLDFLNNKYYGQHVTSESATKTIWEGVLKLYKCSD